ncbi:Cell morphogenesis protein PAG1 [Entomophthora muscae]|uniref:Cell morphogenesis protein PAG1 n=1 Tax=Entomophthora muscae TaxID=34485 RepID=A0ACC2RD83_9FUNG|nr:Cell morphogenesis protein PAG1 [Entomophthora muscae]
MNFSGVNTEAISHSTIDLDSVFSAQPEADKNSIQIPTAGSGSFASRITSASSASSISHISDVTTYEIPPSTLKPASDLPSMIQVVLHAAFERFVQMADGKLETVKSISPREEFRLVNVLARSVDADFDGVLISLGSIGRHCLGLLINSLLTWRSIRISPKPSKEDRRTSRSQALLTDRLNLAVDFILCRSLNCFLDHIKIARGLDQCGILLEGFVFGYIETLTAPLEANSTNHQALYQVLGDVINSLSNLRFASLSDRFIAALEQVPDEGVLEKEGNVVLIIKSMQKLKLKIYPADSLEETAEFLLSCATFFRKTQNPRLKETYSQTFVDMFLPIVPVLVAEVNFPVWVKAVDILLLKASKLLQKLAHSRFALPFAVSVLGVTQKEVFQAKWQGLFEVCVHRSKDKALRPVALCCLSRLVWIYLFRYPDTSSVAHKKLDAIYRLAIASPRRSPLAPALLHQTNIVHCVLSFDPGYGFQSWLSGLLSLESLVSSGIDAIQPDKITIAVKAFIMFLTDTSRAARVPPFPSDASAGDVVLDERLEADARIQAPLRAVLDALDLLLPPLELSYGAMLVNEDWCRPISTLSETLLISQTAELVRAYPKLQVFSIVYSRDKQPFFDMVTAWLEGLPLLIPSNFSTPRVVDFTIRLILHIDPAVSLAAGKALERLSNSRRLHVPVLRSLSKLIQKIKVQFIEVLAPIHSDHDHEGLNLLRVFLRILSSWHDYLVSLSKDALDREDPDAALTWSLIEETEALGLLFLCSAYVPVRRCALDILAVIANIERTYEALVRNGDLSRLPIIDTIKSGEADKIVASQGGTTTAYDAAIAEKHQELWTLSFPHLSKLILDRSPITTVLCRHMVSSRLKQLHPHISALSEADDFPTKLVTPDCIVLEQWGRDLTFVCATITYVAEPKPTYAKRRDQRSSDGIQSAKELFRLVFVLLSCSNRSIRSTVVAALCQINRNIYRHFLEDLQPFVRIVQEDTKSRCTTRDFGSRRRQDGFREGIAECLAKTASTMLEAQFQNDDSLAVQTLPFIQDIFIFLSQSEVQSGWSWQELRIYLCELAHGVFTKLSMTRPAAMTFELRHGLFLLAEKWCGHGAHRDATREREMHMMTEALEPYTDVIARGARTREIEALRRRLELASLKLMAVLCQGPIITASSSFDLPNLFQWIESLLNSPDPDVQPIARQVLHALLWHNMDNPLLYENVLHRCYSLTTSGYFLALADILGEARSPPITPGKRIFLIAHKCGDADPIVRRAACRLLRQHWTTCRLQPTLEDDRLCGRVIHPLATVYEQARVEVSMGLSQYHPELVLEVVSEVVMRIPSIGATNLSAALQLLAPWIHAIRLTLNEGELSAVSNAIVTNMLCLVVKYSDQHPVDVERLWQALLSTAAPSEIEAVLKFLIQVNLEKRNPQLVFHTKNVFIYICRTQAGPAMLEFLMVALTPTSMIPQKPGRSKPHIKHMSSPLFVANLDDYILTHTKRPAFSPGQLVLIFISDIILSFSSLAPHLPQLLHLGACQAFDSGLLPAAIKDLTQPILPSLLIMFVNNNGSSYLVEEIHSLLSAYLAAVLGATPAHSGALESLLHGTMAAMAVHDVPLLEQWCDVASYWATACPIRSVARASFTIYRSFSLPLKPKGLTDIMARLASTLSDGAKDIQNFAHEIIQSLHSRLGFVDLKGWSLTPGLFWFLVGCLNGYNEAEYLQCLSLLQQLVEHMLPADLSGISQFLAHLPDQLYIPSIEDVLILGLSSLEAAPIACDLLFKFLSPPQCDLIVDAQKVHLAILMFSFPYILDTALIADSEEGLPHTFFLSPEQLAEIAQRSECPSLGKTLLGLSQLRFRNENICLQKLLHGLREGFFPTYERECLQIGLGLLFTDTPVLVQRRLKLCKIIMSAVDSHQLDFSGEDAVDVASLLRLLDGEFREEALEVMEDLLSFSNCKAQGSRQDDMGLWESPSDKPQPPALKESHHPSKWGVMPSHGRQESTRSLLAAVAQASSHTLEYSIPDVPIPSDNSLGIDGIGTCDSENFIPPAVEMADIARAVSPFHPPVMTDFYVDAGASPRSYHHYSNSSNSIGNSYRILPQSKRQSSHSRNHSSLASLTDFCSANNCEMGELKNLYSAISDIDGFFSSIPNTDAPFNDSQYL